MAADYPIASTPAQASDVLTLSRGRPNCCAQLPRTFHTSRWARVSRLPKLLSKNSVAGLAAESGRIVSTAARVRVWSTHHALPKQPGAPLTPYSCDPKKSACCARTELAEEALNRGQMRPEPPGPVIIGLLFARHETSKAPPLERAHGASIDFFSSFFLFSFLECLAQLKLS